MIYAILCFLNICYVLSYQVLTSYLNSIRNELCSYLWWVMNFSICQKNSKHKMMSVFNNMCLDDNGHPQKWKIDDRERKSYIFYRTGEYWIYSVKATCLNRIIEMSNSRQIPWYMFLQTYHNKDYLPLSSRHILLNTLIILCLEFFWHILKFITHQR
jgi:hypothetical protein